MSRIRPNVKVSRPRKGLEMTPKCPVVPRFRRFSVRIVYPNA